MMDLRSLVHVLYLQEEGALAESKVPRPDKALPVPARALTLTASAPDRFLSTPSPDRVFATYRVCVQIMPEF